jgi:hypothetical protein
MRSGGRKRTTKSRATKPRGKTKGNQGPPRKAEGQSVIKQKYCERYEDGSCGDALARKLRKYLETEGGTINLGKLQQLAERNGASASRYASLNPGMGRMVVARW